MVSLPVAGLGLWLVGFPLLQGSLQGFATVKVAAARDLPARFKDGVWGLCKLICDHACCYKSPVWVWEEYNTAAVTEVH